MLFSFLQGYRIINLSVLEKQYKTDFTDSFETINLEVARRIVSDPDVLPQQKLLLERMVAVTKHNQLQVNYKCDAKFGRRYAYSPHGDAPLEEKAKYAGSLMYLKRSIKNTLFAAADWVDIDLCKAHPSILLELARANGIEMPFLMEYIEDYPIIIAELMGFYSLPASPITVGEMKNCITVLLFGGSFNTWVKKIQDGDEARGKLPKEVKNAHTMHPIIAAINNEISAMTLLIYNSNRGIDSLEASLCTDLAMTTEEKKNRVVSYFFQIIENHLVVALQKELEKAKIMKRTKKSWGYDGLTIPRGKKNTEEIADAIHSINNILRERFQMHLLEFRIKPFDDVMAFVAEGETLVVDSDQFSHPTYVAWKEEFTKRCWYVKFSKNLNWVMKLTKTFGALKIISYEFYDKKALIGSDMLNTYTYSDREGKKRTDLCINSFFLDKNQEEYLYTVYNAPGFDELQIPSEKCLNIWVDSPYEEIYYVRNAPGYNDDVVDLVLDFFRNLFPDKESFEYIIKWIAKGIQYPASKLTCLSITGDQGTGKGTIGQLLRNLHGMNRTAQLDDPGKHLFSDFNEVREGKVLLFLDETTQQQSHEFISQLKSLITENKTVINAKFQNRREVSDFSKIYHASNSLHSFKLERTDRRFFVEKTSNFYKGKLDFFTDFHDLISDQENLRSIYGFFKAVNVSQFRHEDIYNTKLRKSIIKNTVQPIDLFLIHYARKITEEKYDQTHALNLEVEWHKTNPKNLYQIYCDYLKEIGSSFPAKDSNCLINLIMTSGFRSPHSVEFIRRETGKFGYSYHFNIKAIIELFKTMYGEDEDDVPEDENEASGSQSEKRIRLS